MKKIYAFLVSAPLMGSLFVVLAIAMGVATFIENDFGSNASKALVYNSWWFEAAFALLAFNLFGNLLKFKMMTWSHLPVTLFHASFFIILLGAAITRYIGYEGIMHIRENEESGQILSQQTYVTVKTIQGDVVSETSDEVFFSTITPFECNIKTNDGTVVKSEVFVPGASLQPAEDPNGTPHLVMVGAMGMGRQEIVLVPEQTTSISDINIGFEVKDTSNLQLILTHEEGVVYYQSTVPMIMIQMQTGQADTFAVGKKHPLYSGVLYSIGEARLVLKQFYAKAVLRPVYQPGVQGLPDAVVFSVEKNGQKRQVTALGKTAELGQPALAQIDDTRIEISFGAIPIDLPFKLHLTDFILDRYPGSHSPSSFASEVILIDDETGIREDRRIFMNNILNYRGYRFFQSSYDMDELGTVLSVNRDPWGTILTYIGYFLMSLGMILALIMPKTRFRMLYKLTSELAKQRKNISAGLVLLLMISLAPQQAKAQQKPSLQEAHAFGNLWVQDNNGRTKPLNSLNSEIARKLVKHNSFKGFTADELVLDLLMNPIKWQNEPLITITHPQLRQIIGPKGKKATFKQFFGLDGGYKIGDAVESAYRKKASERDKFDQELMKVDEQVNVFYMVQSGKLFKLFPNPADSHLPWLNPQDFPATGYTSADSLFVRNVFPLYITALSKGDTAQAKEYLDAIYTFQNKYAADILPSSTHKKVEIFYNNTNVFMLLMPFLMVLGGLLLVLQFVNLLIPRLNFKIVDKTGLIILLITFAVYTAGLALRWYVSGHAPWSNGYESMLYIGYCTFVAGLIFSRKNSIALSVSALFTSIILMVAHLSWMNPEITNLVPVLKSYWLTIHVAIIVASYGFLGLGALLAFTNLLILGMKNLKNARMLNLTVDELSAIAEMSLTVGLYLLTIGAFLGGVWANESWGRYWGWDPKETWSAVTILVYAFILHMRMIPGLKGAFAFNLASLIGFSSVLMTYLGVNYYLAGLHSYAKGDPVPVPEFVYYTVVIIAVVAGYAWYNNNKVNKAEN